MVTAKYDVEWDDAGHLVKVVNKAENAEGAPITTNENNQDFCDFLTWASRHAPLEDAKRLGIKSNTWYFAMKSASWSIASGPAS